MTEDKITKPAMGYGTGKNQNYCLGLTNLTDGILKEFKEIKFEFKRAALAYNTSIFELVEEEGKPCILYFSSQNRNERGKKLYFESPIAQLKSGAEHFLIKTLDGKIFGLGKSNRGQLTREGNSFETCQEITYFKEKNLEVKKIRCSADQSYFHCANNDLYFCGQIAYGNYGSTFKSGEDSRVPVICSKNVKRFWTGSNASFFFFSDFQNKLYARGNNNDGQFGSGTKQSSPNKQNNLIPNINADEIVCMGLGFSFSTMAVLKQNEKSTRVFAAGGHLCGHNRQTLSWQELLVFKNQNIVQIEAGYYHSIARSSNNEFWLWGESSQGQLLDITNNKKIPTKIKFNKFPEIENNPYIKAKCGSYSTIIFSQNKSTLINDLREAYKNEFITDLEIEGIKVHKIFIEKRLNTDSNKIIEIFENRSYDEKTIRKFFESVYLSKLLLSKLYWDQMSKLFNIEALNLQNLQRDLLILYKDEDSKDFDLLVADNDDEEDDEEGNDDDDDEEEEEDDDCERIPVHKFILAIRSGLFREMFQNINKDIKEIKDYSGKTVESIEILIKYFYTDKIELTADDDPELVVEELSDAVEYYQLNENSNLPNELELIKKQFNLN
ncbi:regulator of chromosome condensation [Anaeramoeba flamelloides]|uniref:Regulator of chromosome condensation n=1 Tax=Anaeramoeba flamelloides TaxID=1746091 RepID=A0ABQ8Z6U4_9EUKA|nr:regulator of chromosome condensation [Anaeramoeba flamelloides]